MEDESWFDYQTGDKPPDGNYVCMSCASNDPYIHMVPLMGEELPICPVCGKDGYYASF